MNTSSFWGDYYHGSTCITEQTLHSYHRQPARKIGSRIPTKKLTCCLLLFAWFLWFQLLRLFSEHHSASDLLPFNFILIFYCLLLIIGTVGFILSRPKLILAFLLAQFLSIFSVGGVVVQNIWYFHGGRHGPLPISFLSFIILCYLAALSMIITYMYITELREAAIKEEKGVRIQLFSSRLFGTPPTKEFERIELDRCHRLSDSMLDDIFKDYKDEVTLQ